MKAPASIIIGSDTAAACWLCNRERGELCDVHERARAEAGQGHHDDGDGQLVLAWVNEREGCVGHTVRQLDSCNPIS